MQRRRIYLTIYTEQNQRKHLLTSKKEIVLITCHHWIFNICMFMLKWTYEWSRNGLISILENRYSFFACVCISLGVGVLIRFTNLPTFLKKKTPKTRYYPFLLSVKSKKKSHMKPMERFLRNLCHPKYKDG